MSVILDDVSKFHLLDNSSFDDTLKIEVKLQKRFRQLHKCKFLIKEMMREFDLWVHNGLECTGYLKFTSLMFHWSQFFLCGSVQHELANGWLNRWTRSDNFILVVVLVTASYLRQWYVSSPITWTPSLYGFLSEFFFI